MSAIMKKILFVASFFSCWTTAFAQQKNATFDNCDKNSFLGCTESRICAGSCRDVIGFLRTSQNNDSVAIEVFRKEYKIVNMGYRQRDWLQKKSHTEVIQYFAKEENRKYKCQSKYSRFRSPVLLKEE